MPQNDDVAVSDDCDVDVHDNVKHVHHALRIVRVLFALVSVLLCASGSLLYASNVIFSLLCCVHKSFRYCLYNSATSTADIQSINDDDNDDDSVTHADNAIRIVRVTFATCWLLLCAVRDLLSPLQRMPFAVCCVMRTSCIVIHTRCSCTKPIAGPVETTLATPPPKKAPQPPITLAWPYR